MDKMTSIAFPTLGCGFLNYPPEAVAETLFQCILLFIATSVYHAFVLEVMVLK